MPSQPPRSIGKLRGVPEPPPHYLPREADLVGLKQKLLAGDANVFFLGNEVMEAGVVDAIALLNPAVLGHCFLVEERLPFL
jgi:hypothetical protein